MKSRITIEVDFENANLPIIQILHKASDDVRDKLVSGFLQSFAHSSRWCKILYQGEYKEHGEQTDVKKWAIVPITKEKIKDERSLMYAVLTQGDAVSPAMYATDHKFGDDVGEAQFREMFFKRSTLNPYPTGSPSYTGYEKGFEECYACFSKAQPNPALSELSQK